MTTPENTLIHASADQFVVEGDGGQITLGDWYWVKSVASWDDEKAGRKKGDEYEWLGCAVGIGSNYVLLKSVDGGTARVHFDRFWEILRRETHPQSVLDAEVAKWQQTAKHLIAEIHDVTRRLGVSPSNVNSDAALPGTSRNALMVMSAQVQPKHYQQALILAKEKTLPALHEQLKHAHKELACWMKGAALPLEAAIAPMKETIATIDDRLFSLGLYAGLAESAVKCCDGDTAPANARLHVMQRRLYMDEECLLNYEAGGMEFANLAAFDSWLCKPENRDRILPHPRTLVAMRVRRHPKERETHGRPLAEFIKFQEEQADKFTYLYVRNGGAVWRITTELDFGEIIFPDSSFHLTGEPMMMRRFAGSITAFMTRREYDSHLQELHEREAEHAAWRKANPSENSFRSPFRESSYIPGVGYFRAEEWEPFDKNSVFFDDGMEVVNADIMEFNRVAVIIQGLFDRSEVLHPHPVVQTWVPESFASAVVLVNDGTAALHDGEKPNFEKFRAELNATLEEGSIVVGQERVWMMREAEKENARRDRDLRTGAPEYRYQLYRPYDDPGPGRVSKISEWRQRSRTAVFHWEKESRQYGKPPVRKSLSVPAAELLNVSAYRPGDYRRFFLDVRTRAEYLQWAPLLLAAEDWHAGVVRESVSHNSFR